MAGLLQHNTYMKYATMGTEFSATIGIMLFLGYWADKKFQSFPIGIVAGLVIGFSVGLHSLIKQARQAKKDIDSQTEQNRCNKKTSDSK